MKTVQKLFKEINLNLKEINMKLNILSVKTILCISILFFLFCQFLNAQDLKRKGFLGIQMKYIETQNGIKILKVFENSTASNLKLKTDDVILSINNLTFGSINDFVNEVKNWRENDKKIFKIIRNNKILELKGKVKAKPIETSKHGKVIYGEVDFDNGMLRSILEIPNGVSKPPTILFLPGIGCASYDFGFNENHIIKLFIESLVERGIAVYRVEKPGIGDSFGTKNCFEMDYNYEVDAFRAALKKLKTIQEIDSNKIILFGESLSVLTAPQLANENNVAGIIAWGGLSKTWYEYYMDLQRKQKVLLGIDYETIDSSFRKNNPFYFDFLVRKKTPNELAENPDYQEMVKNNFIGNLWRNLHHFSYFHTLNDIDVLSEYKKVKCPVLCLAGEFDIHTANSEWGKEITAAVNKYQPNQGEFVIVPKTTHHYYKVESIDSYNHMRKNNLLTNQYELDNFSYDLVKIMGKWITENTM